MALARNTLLALLASAVIGTTPQSVQADTYHHIDELALELQEQARELYSELGMHCRHVGAFSHMRSDAAKLYRLAAHIHAMAHRRSELCRLEEDVDKADDVFLHLEEMIEDSDTDHHFGGHSHGISLYVRRLMRDIGDTLHHLQDDVQELSLARPPISNRRSFATDAPASDGRNYGRPTYGRDVDFRSFTIGNNGWSFRFSR